MMKHGWYHVGNYLIAVAMVVAVYGYFNNLNYVVFNMPAPVTVAIVWIFYVVLIPPILAKYLK